MTHPDGTIPEQTNQTQVINEEREEAIPNGVYATTKHTNNKSPSEWLKMKQSSGPDTTTNPANMTRNINNKRNENSEEYNRQLNYLHMQNNVYLKTGYPDTRAYYGWLPGISPMRFPALIYPHSFFGFAPTVAWMKKNDNSSVPATTIEKIDRWQQKNRNDTSTLEENHSGHDSSVYREKITSDTATTNNSEDEGLVLDDREMFKRHRQKEGEKLQEQAMKLSQERSSVIQENISIQAKPSVITHSQDATKTPESEQTKPAKRGRASTRQIEKTEQYWDRRKKNNVSAKKSRDARRQREALTNQRSAMLETENLRLRAELATLRDENSRLKQEVSSLKNTQT